MNQLALRPELTDFESDGLPPSEKRELADAIRVLTRRGRVLGRLAEVTGGFTARIGARGLRLVPGLEAAVTGVAEAALARAFDVAVFGLPADKLRLGRERGRERGRGRASSALVGVSGALSGFTGFAGFIPDAFVTTLAIMRNVAEIALEEGEDLTDPDAKLACLAVFGSSPATPGASGDAPDISYFLTRSALHGRPLAILVSEIARRYGLSLSQKFMVQAVPLLGAAGGAGLNVAYLAHYRGIARAVFTLRRLRRKHGDEVISSDPSPI